MMRLATTVTAKRERIRLAERFWHPKGDGHGRHERLTLVGLFHRRPIPCATACTHRRSARSITYGAGDAALTAVTAYEALGGGRYREHQHDPGPVLIDRRAARVMRPTDAVCRGGGERAFRLLRRPHARGRPVPHTRQGCQARSIVHGAERYHTAGHPSVPGLCPPRYACRARRPPGPPAPLVGMAHAAHVHLRLPPLWGRGDSGGAAGDRRTAGWRSPSVCRPSPLVRGRTVVVRAEVACIRTYAPCHAVIGGVPEARGIHEARVAMCRRIARRSPRPRRMSTWRGACRQDRALPLRAHRWVRGRVQPRRVGGYGSQRACSAGRALRAHLWRGGGKHRAGRA